MKFRTCVSVVVCAFATLVGSASAFAQTSGQIGGTVRDTQGGVLPGVSVTATNVNTGIGRTEVTNTDGSYLFTNLPIGTYSVVAQIEGFRRAEKTGFELTADGRITADFALTVGGLSETVEVTAVRGETVNRTSGEIARTVDGDQVRELALSGRNFLELASLIPGAVQTEDDQMAITTGLGTGGTIINGARGNSNNLTVDGGFNLDSGSNGSMINNVGLDFIEQVKMQTSNFSAEYGRNSGASINVVTKSGTNRLRGSVFETFRDESLDAGNYFAPRDASGKKIKGRLDFNDYGASFGGPLRRNKMFFFVGLEFKTLNRTESPQRRTLPTLAELRGDFSARLSGADGIIGTTDDSTVPDTLLDATTGQPFPGGVIPASRITADGRAIARVYEAMIQRAAVYSDTPTTNNATYQLDFPFDWRQEIVRLDYRHNSSHSLYFRYLHDSYDLIEPRGTFIGADLPTISTNRIRPGFGYLLGHSWVLSNSLFNEVKLNVSGNGQRIPPYGDAWRRDTYGFTFPQAFDGGQYDEGIPDVAVSGIASLTGPSASLLSPTTDITATNTLTWQKATHSFRAGFLVTRNRKDQNGRLAHTGDVVFNTSTPNTAAGPGGTAAGRNPLSFADALLGNFRTYNEGADDPIGFFRFTQYGGFVSDTWRVRENLSLEAGLRYELAAPIYTQGNNISNFDPALYDATQAVTLNRNGTIVPGSGTNRYTGLIRAGDGVPADQQNRVTIDERAAALIPTGAPRGLYDPRHLFMPRISAAYSVSDKTVLRGGIGLFYDKPEGNTIFSQVNLPPWVPSISVENGNLSNPLGGQAAAAAVLDTVNAIDPNLEIPKQWNFSVSVQRELRGGHFAEISYVGNRGRDLLWLPELNRVALPELAANQALPAAQRAAENFLRPYKGYSSIRQRRSDMYADYNSLQFYVNRRKGVIKYTVSYTLSKAEGNASGNGDNTETGLTIQDAIDTDFLVGPLSYDRRHVLVTTWTYQMPFLRDRRDLLGLLVGGWELSGKTRWQSGQYLTPTGQRNTGNRRADYVGGEISLPSSERSENRWFNTDAFATAPDDRRGNAAVGMIQGPHVFTVDPSLRKNFRLRGQSRINLRVDAFNVLNRVNFNNPAVRQDQAAFGTITAARPPRQMQFSVRFEF